MDQVARLWSISLVVGIALYAGLLFWIITYWRAGRRQYLKAHLPSDTTRAPFFSILIPARNEASNIQACLQSLLAQNYPANSMEVIIIDDHSEDETAAQIELLRDERLEVVALQEGLFGKKAALSQGIAKARGHVIITTDADCTFDQYWLKHLAATFQLGYDMVLGPVQIKSHKQLLYTWQCLDVCGTILLTGAAVAADHPILANGANLAFRKTLFTQLQGFEGNEDRASGDDIFLLQKAVKDTRIRIAFTFHRDTIAYTTPAKSWSALFWQRLRWAGKTSGYTDAYLLLFQAGVYLLNTSLLLGAVVTIFYPSEARFLIVAWLAKALAEFIYLYFATKEIGNLRWLRWFPISFFLHGMYVVLIGSLALLPFSFSRWKGRKV